MIYLNTDLDNTLIYSYKREIGNSKTGVEIYAGREISFMTDKSCNMLKELNKRIIIVPTTTRTYEQYSRINLGIGNIKYALVCNGGILVTDGKEDESWYKESLELVKSSRPQLLKAVGLLEKDARRILDTRFLRELFVYTKCNFPEEVVKDLKEALDMTDIDVFNNGVKVYVVPKKLSKGMAIERFRKKVAASYIVAAGDSEFDVSMLDTADMSFAPYSMKQMKVKSKKAEYMEEGIFSEQMLERMLKWTEKNNNLMETLKMDDVPWSRLMTPYERASNIPKYIKGMNTESEEEVDANYISILENIEHQDSLWPVTPFAMLFLTKIFKENIAAGIREYSTKKLIEIFIRVKKACNYAKEMYPDETADSFLTLLDEENLCPEQTDVLYDNDILDRMYYNYYYYSDVILERIRPLLSDLQFESDETANKRVRYLTEIMGGKNKDV